MTSWIHCRAHGGEKKEEEGGEERSKWESGGFVYRSDRCSKHVSIALQWVVCFSVDSHRHLLSLLLLPRIRLLDPHQILRTRFPDLLE